MKLYTSTDFEGFWPVGTSAVILANSEEEARELLKEELVNRNLPPWGSFTVQKVSQSRPTAIILNDGNY